MARPVPGTPPMRAFRYMGMALSGLLLTGLAGCASRSERYVLNPDGSGKVTLRVEGMDPWNARYGKGDRPRPDAPRTPEECIRLTLAGWAKREIGGVEAWRDIHYGFDENTGRAWCEATAYFPDFARFRLGEDRSMYAHAEQSRNPWRDAPAVLARDDATWTLGFRAPSDNAAQRASLLYPDEDAFAVWARTATLAVRAETTLRPQPARGASKPESVGRDVSIHVPGRVREAVGFAESTEGGSPLAGGAMVRWRVDAADEAERLRTRLNDDAWLMARLRRAPRYVDYGWFAQQPPEPMPRVVVEAGDAPLFDYAVEVAAAKAEWGERVREIRGDAAEFQPEPPPMPRLASDRPLPLTLWGATYSLNTLTHHNRRPFFDRHESLTAGTWDVSLVGGPLPARAFEVRRVEVDEAFAPDGASLLGDQHEGKGHLIEPGSMKHRDFGFNSEMRLVLPDPFDGRLPGVYINLPPPPPRGSA